MSVSVLSKLEYQTDMEGIEQLEETAKKKTHRNALRPRRNAFEALLKLYEADGKKLGEAEEIKL